MHLRAPHFEDRADRHRLRSLAEALMQNTLHRHIDGKYFELVLREPARKRRVLHQRPPTGSRLRRISADLREIPLERRRLGAEECAFVE
jgi:hypothetical protein